MTASLPAESPQAGRRSDEPAVAAIGVTVRHGPLVAVDDVSVRVRAGTLTALLGPNGAGKSSLLSVLCTAVPPDSGHIRILGHDVRRRPVAARRCLGLVFQERTLDRDLTVEGNLRFHARLFGVRRSVAEERIDRLLAASGLAAERARRVEHLSGGTARRVEIVRALLQEPAVLMLDEPTAGLDPRSRRLLWDDLRRLRDEVGATVLYATHYMDEAEHADDIVIMAGGRVGRCGSPAELKDELDTSRVCVVTDDDPRASRALRAAGLDTWIEDGELRVRCARPDQRIAEITRVVHAAGIAVSSVAARRPSMDDVFLAATGAAS